MVQFGFEEGEVKGFTTSGEGTVDNFSLRLLRLRLKKKRARRSEMRTTPVTPPMIAPVGLVVEELGE